MTAQEFSSALGQIDERYVYEALTYTPKKKCHPWLKWGTIAACFCLAAFTAFAVIPIFRDAGDHSGGTVVDNVLPSDIDDTIWSDTVGADGGSAAERLAWNGFWVDDALYEVLRTSSPDQYIAVIMTKSDGGEIERAEYEQILDAMINRDERNGKLYLFITKDTLLHWNLENKSDYAFRLGDRSDYEEGSAQ